MALHRRVLEVAAAAGEREFDAARTFHAFCHRLQDGKIHRSVRGDIEGGAGAFYGDHALQGQVCAGSFQLGLLERGDAVVVIQAQRANQRDTHCLIGQIERGDFDVRLNLRGFFQRPGHLRMDLGLPLQAGLAT